VIYKTCYIDSEGRFEGDCVSETAHVRGREFHTLAASTLGLFPLELPSENRTLYESLLNIVLTMNKFYAFTGWLLTITLLRGGGTQIDTPVQ
jgi:hypothetical protein